jgi:predicted nucleic acid-binding protein
VKVFLDTNVLASALATRGLCAELFESVLTGHELLASRGLLAELRRILTAKLRIPADTTAAFLTLIEANATISADTRRISRRHSRSRRCAPDCRSAGRRRGMLRHR